uniref:Uncharacterized protein n=1 Tax=uncultured Thiotrichaceae bacterium TaxID=298394 RepID=A0A6S6SWQ6_9GAMM|nr:MAG: Unknown protein [uncultured Thiotrichaceae bacterium]
MGCKGSMINARKKPVKTRLVIAIFAVSIVRPQLV